MHVGSRLPELSQEKFDGRVALHERDERKGEAETVALMLVLCDVALPCVRRAVDEYARVTVGSELPEDAAGSGQPVSEPTQMLGKTVACDISARFENPVPSWRYAESVGNWLKLTDAGVCWCYSQDASQGLRVDVRTGDLHAHIPLVDGRWHL